MQTKFNDKRILVVDDDPFNCLALKELFKVVGLVNAAHIVDTCFGGNEAYQKIRDSISFGERAYGLILSDCQMPEMDGYELTSRAIALFKEQGISPEHMPEIVAITGHVEVEYME